MIFHDKYLTQSLAIPHLKSSSEIDLSLTLFSSEFPLENCVCELSYSAFFRNRWENSKYTFFPFFNRTEVGISFFSGTLKYFHIYGTGDPVGSYFSPQATCYLCTFWQQTKLVVRVNCYRLLLKLCQLCLYRFECTRTVSWTQLECCCTWFSRPQNNGLYFRFKLTGIKNISDYIFGK